MSQQSWQSILVAVREPGSRKQVAIAKATRLAVASGARLTLFHAFSTPFPLPRPMPADPEKILDAVGRARLAELKALARPLQTAGLKVECAVTWDFPPYQAIVRRVRETRPDLLVAESHRHSRLARWFLANTDWDLIRECPCPVWFVKNERLAKRPLVLAAIDPGHAHAKPSGLDTRLMRAAGAAAAELDGRVALIHAEAVTGTAATPIRAEVRRLARRHGVGEALQLVRPGNPAEVLTAGAADLKADVLVLGAVSRSNVGHAFIGNTAEAVIDGVGCDLLIVKPRGFRSSVQRKRPSLAQR